MSSYREIEQAETLYNFAAFITLIVAIVFLGWVRGIYRNSIKQTSLLRDIADRLPPKPPYVDEVIEEATLE